MIPSWLALFLALECGFIPSDNTDNTMIMQNWLYTEFEAEITVFDMIFVGGSTRCFFTPVKGDYVFRPQVMEYLFRVGFRYGPMELGLSHQCNHRREYLSILGGYEEIYIRISMEK